MTPEYHRPNSIDQAVALLAEKPRTVLAGGTDLYPATKAQSLHGCVLDLNGIAGLRGVTREDAGWRIGAGTTWTDVLRADLPPAFDGLKRAAREVGAAQIQNVGTLAGNLCNASPAADGAPPLLTLDSAVEMVSERGKRVLPLGEFLIGPRRTALASDEMVSALLIPAGADAGMGNFAKLGARTHLVISIAMVAARLVVEDGQVTVARVAVGSCSATARRLMTLERSLMGGDAGDVAAHVREALDPIDDVRGTAGYRKDAAAAMVSRMIEGMMR